MKIIKEGELTSTKGCCNKCNAVFEYNSNDISWNGGFEASDDTDENYINCPCCFNYIVLD